METNTNTNSKDTQAGEQKSWQEKITGQIASDKDLLAGLLKLLSHPLVFVVLLLAAGWWFSKKQPAAAGAAEAGTARELKKLKKKYKKLKRKQSEAMTGAGHNRQRKVQLD
ncbi:MAG TPA: hypothetical protein PKA77_15480 [Chitinophagaceae bacterium]|jgi:hypothetical protein|nr:hypothetical protein [Chitinophagaceae bacterium]HMU59576.1 hypothetical protein [Chitinophagaceae bacterium]